MTLTTRIKKTYNWPIEKDHSLLSRTHQRRTEHSLDTGTDLDHNEVLQILVDDRRRYALEFLASQPTGETVSLSDLADVVAARENDCSLQEVTSTQRKRVYIALYQRHSDSMSEIVDIDTDRKMFKVTVATKRAWTAYTAFQQKLTG